jgi:hypothetical protein
MYLLSWSVPFKDDSGYETHNLAYTSKEKAMREGEEIIRHKHAGAPVSELKQLIDVFRHDRLVDYHYCFDVTVQPLTMID